MFRRDDPARKRSHLGAGLDPGFGEDAQALRRDGALGDNDLGGQDKAGELLDFWTRENQQGRERLTTPESQRGPWRSSSCFLQK